MDKLNMIIYALHKTEDLIIGRDFKDNMGTDKSGYKRYSSMKE